MRKLLYWLLHKFDYYEDIIDDKVKVREAELDERNRRITQLETANRIVSEAYEKLTPMVFVQRMIQKGIEWYNYKALDHAGQMGYWNDAQSLLRNPVFQNEIQAMKSELVKYVAMESRSHEETMGVRTAIVNLEAFVERINDIENPNKKQTEEGINEAI